MKAIYNNTIIAQSDKTVEVEGNHYFPPESVKMEFFKKSGNTYTCTWKGTCDYYDVSVEGNTAKDSAWMYPEPTKPAENIKGYFAFWKDVKVTE